MKAINFFNFKEAEEIKFLEPKEKHLHFIYDFHNPSDQTILCTNDNKCPVCDTINIKKKSFSLRFKIFVLDIKDAFKKLFKRRV